MPLDPKKVADFKRKIDQQNLDMSNRKTWEGAQEKEQENLAIRPKLHGYKKGGKVKKTGPAKVHQGEFVVKKSAAKKIGAKKLNKMNRESADVRLLKRARA